MNSKKVVITGGPGTGKSTLINQLIKNGYTCLEEISRQIILDAQKKGTEQLFLTEPLLFSKLLLKGRIQQFEQANYLQSEITFFDRGVHDVLAYMNYIGNTYPKHFVEACENAVYDTVFILKPWEEIYISDNERYENFNQAQAIHDHLLNTYKAFNYNLIDVPFGTVEYRTNFILNALKP
ncbi:AAA family ATPase [Mariniflexile jejuense]|uniref:AAA family ATPase n=1 Tax=Mariniflexile jejuense TaxID=1173582 RepID=A0ABW3JLJ9_9FLAO